jgi:predicted DNA-binding protein
MKLIRTNIYLRADHHKKLKALSEKEDRAVSAIIRRAIEEYLKKR